MIRIRNNCSTVTQVSGNAQKSWLSMLGRRTTATSPMAIIILMFSSHSFRRRLRLVCANADDCELQTIIQIPHEELHRERPWTHQQPIPQLLGLVNQQLNLVATFQHFRCNRNPRAHVTDSISPHRTSEADVLMFWCMLSLTLSRSFFSACSFSAPAAVEYVSWNQHEATA